MIGPADIEALQRDVVELRRRVADLERSEARYRGLFEDAPIALWEEDFSDVQRFIDDLRRSGVQDLRAHFTANVDDAARCAQLVRVLDVNEAAVQMYRAGSKAGLFAGIHKTFSDTTLQEFSEEIARFADGRNTFECETTNYTLDGTPIRTLVKVLLMPNDEQRWERVFVAILDITARAQAEEATQRTRMQEEIIQAQRSLIGALSTPVMRLSDGVLVMPLVGMLDAQRMERMTAVLLREVERQGAATAIVDITGVPTVDSPVAHMLAGTAKAVRLLGSTMVLTGIRAEAARMMVGLGVDLQGIVTYGTLGAGIGYAQDRTARR